LTPATFLVGLPTSAGTPSHTF